MNEIIDINTISQEELDALIADVLSGNYTQQEYDTLSKWRSLDQTNEEHFQLVKSYWDADMSDRFNIDAQKEFNKLIKRIDKSNKRKNIFSARNIWMTTAVAASLVVGLICGWAFKGNEVITSSQYTYMTGESISKFTLPDGSVVHLNKNSRLDYNGSFAKDGRRVHLQGEGYFDVKRMADCKFVVDLDGASVTVKGTSFNAFNNEESGVKGAALVSGSIQFESKSQIVQLTPSRQATYDSINNELTISVFDPAIVTDWKDKLFRYKSLTMTELVEQIKDVYDMEIVVVGEMSKEKYSGALDVGLPIISVVDLIASQTNTTWTKRNGVYYISK